MSWSALAALGMVLQSASWVAAQELEWRDAQSLAIEGRGFDDTAIFYDRLPARAEGVVRGPVWSLSRNSAGMAVRFVTDSPKIAVRWKLRSASLDMVHMPATGASGVDLYGRDSENRWRWIQVGRPAEQSNEQVLADGLPEGQREYRIYFPLYNGLEQLEVGVLPGSHLEAGPAWPANKKPIVFYGTSITHGACASRPGATYSAILGRRFDRPIINLGFSGNGKMEPEVAALLAELDPAVYVINCLPNMNANEVRERAGKLVEILRAAHPDTPIVLVEDRSYANSNWFAAQAERNRTSRVALREAYEQLLSAGVTGLSYVPGDTLLGEDRDDTVDGSHPSDLGFYRMADALEGTIRTALGE